MAIDVFPRPRPLLFLLLLVSLLSHGGAAPTVSRPRLIVSVLVDDLGFGDFGFTGSQIRTPTFDRLRSEGVLLTSAYVQPICTPTRASFLTNRYPLGYGLQGKQTVQQGCSWGLDLEEQTFVSSFAAANWSTHMVGKAHLGADYWRRTPTYRGFDSFLGYLYGAEDYFSHVLAGAYDLRNDTGRECGPGCSENIAAALSGTYSSAIFGAEVARLIAAAAASPAPTYIHFTPQSVHAPLEAPQEYIAPYLPVFGPNNTARAVHAGALTALDDAMGNITAAIDAAGLAGETLIFVMADNGGCIGTVGDGNMASNYPLRGGKHSLYEGGVKAAAFAWGVGLGGQQRDLSSSSSSGSAAASNRSWGGLVHVSDVGLTLLEAAQVAPLPPKPGRPLHGVSFWGALVSGGPSDREEVVVNVDYTNASQAAIVTPDGFKLILGTPADPESLYGYWSGPTGEPENPPLRPSGVVAAAAAAALGNADGGKRLDGESALNRGAVAPSPLWPLSNMTATLFDLRADPRETTDVAALYPAVVANLTARLAAWGVIAVPVVENATADPRSNPKYFNGSWTPWLGLGP